MSFQQGLSGLNATSKNLEVIGNNVANAGTYGFKSARAEFADMYATSMNGTGTNNIGIGVNLAQAPEVPGRATVALARFGPAPDRDSFAARLAGAFAEELARWRHFGLAALAGRWQAVAHPVGAPLVARGAPEGDVAGHFAGLLSTAGFPGERSSDSAEYQTLAAWQQALDAGRPLDRDSMTELGTALDKGEVQTLVVLGANPAYDAPVDFRFAERLKNSKATLIHLGMYRDETAQLAALHIPGTHFLESWGDLRGRDGTASIVQPLIAPLYKGWSELELISFLCSGRQSRGFELVRETWRGLAVSRMPAPTPPPAPAPPAR